MSGPSWKPISRNMAHVTEDDIQDGTAKIKRALLEVFYELDKACGEGDSLFRKRVKATAPASLLLDKNTVVDRQQQKLPTAASAALGVLTASSLVDPDEAPIL